MSILRCFVHWYVWWGRNAFYYYSRPLVWAFHGLDVISGARYMREMEVTRVQMQRAVLRKAVERRRAQAQRNLPAMKKAGM